MEYFRIEGIKEGEKSGFNLEKNQFGKFGGIIHGSILKRLYCHGQVYLEKSPEGLMEFLTEAKVYEIK